MGGGGKCLIMNSGCSVCVCVCVCVYKRIKPPRVKTIVCVDTDCVMCTSFRDLTISRNVSILDVKTWGTYTFLREPFSMGSLFMYAGGFFSWNHPSMLPYVQTQAPSSLLQLIPAHLSGFGATSFKVFLEPPPVSQSGEGVPPLASQWPTRVQS